MSTSLLARRVAPYWSIKRATGRFEKRVLSIVTRLDSQDRPQIRYVSVDKLFREATSNYGDGKFKSSNRRLNKINSAIN